MILITARIATETIKVKIDNREVFYSDRLFQNLIRLIPPDENFLTKIINSRNKIPKHIVNLFILTKAEQAEYNNCKTNEELAQVCINDIRRKGGKIISIEK